MSERKSKREDASVELDDEGAGYVLEPAQVELGAGYALSIHYDAQDKPVIDVKTYGKIDVAKMLKEIARVYPNARIHHLNQSPIVAVAKKQKKKRKK
ncbi:MAG: hypothetical protein QXD70_04790 [Candidatus Bathyarchaeia archaeon]